MKPKLWIDRFFTKKHDLRHRAIVAEQLVKTLRNSQDFHQQLATTRTQERDELRTVLEWYKAERLRYRKLAEDLRKSLKATAERLERTQEDRKSEFEELDYVSGGEAFRLLKEREDELRKSQEDAVRFENARRIWERFAIKSGVEANRIQDKYRDALEKLETAEHNLKVCHENQDIALKEAQDAKAQLAQAADDNRELGAKIEWWINESTKQNAEMRNWKTRALTAEKFINDLKPDYAFEFDEESYGGTE